MQDLDSTRRDFLKGIASSLTITALQPLFAAQADTVNGFQKLTSYAIKLYDETESYNYRRNEKGDFIPRLDREMKFSYLHDGTMHGRRTLVHVGKDLPSGRYSLESKTYSNREDIPFGGSPVADEFAKLFLYPNTASNIFLDKGMKGNVRGRTDAVTAISMEPKAVEYSMLTGDGGYYFANLTVPVIPQGSEEQFARERELEAQNLVKKFEDLGFSERNTIDLLGILTSFDGYPYRSSSHVPFVMLPFVDGFAWYSPSGIVHSYWDFKLDNARTGVNVGRQPRLIGAYTKTSHAELQRKREEAFGNANKENSRIMQGTIDILAQDGKI